jgi:hypothetical protein
LGAHGGPARWGGFTGDPTWFYQPAGGPLFDLAVFNMLASRLPAMQFWGGEGALTAPQFLIKN